MAYSEALIMSLSKNTLTILKNFSQINPGIIFFPGNELRTMRVTRDIFAEAKIQETFPFEIAIYDLQDFLKIYKPSSHLFFDEKEEAMIIKTDDNVTTYSTSRPSIVISPGQARINFPEGENNTKFILGKEPLEMILKIRSRLKQKHLIIRDKEFVLTSYNKNPISFLKHPFMEYGGQQSLLKLDLIRCLMRLDYDVEISQEKGIARFISRDKRFRLTYYLDLDDSDKIESLLGKSWVGGVDIRNPKRRPKPKPYKSKSDSEKEIKKKITKKKFKNGEEQHYDENENLVYFKSAEGQEQWYEYD